MNILVCVKRVPAPGARINITSDGQQVDTAFLGFTVSPHEECAVEQAVQLIEKHGGDVTVLTLGPAEAEEQLRTAVSTGATKAVLVPIDTTDWDPQRTAQAIAKVIVELETKNGKFDLVLFSNDPPQRVRTTFNGCEPLNSLSNSRQFMAAGKSRRAAACAIIS